jgi:hypothetical protein
MATQAEMVNTIIVLSHELGVALEMSYSPEEMQALWPEALDGLKRSLQILEEQGISPPPVVMNVLTITGDH